MLTIGYGHTGTDVYIGQRITEAEAEELLRADLKRFEEAVNRLITRPLTQHEYDAITSFTFNIGIGALEISTFRKRINSGEPKRICFTEEFPRWVNGFSGPLPGLVSRRNAEIALAYKL
nr:hypothetical protein 2 [bacterium]BDD46699.1 hypothetical protein 10 [Paracoccaceae bacterium]BDD46755.1 hypothetical protein 8 [Paracoccaceae bacterium]